MKTTLAVLAFISFAVAAQAASAQKIYVPSDRRASYTAVEVKNAGRGMIEIITKRNGPSGTSYARRLVDCVGSKFKYLGEGDTLEEARRNRPSPGMGSLVQGSISYYVSAYACLALK